MVGGQYIVFFSPSYVYFNDRSLDQDILGWEMNWT